MEQQDLFGYEGIELDKMYSTKKEGLIYNPSNKCPFIQELYSDKKYKRLLMDIEQSNISEQEKSFLRIAATRHIVFNYSKIADYYAHAPIEVQELFEQSALVIIDFDKAIEMGYVKMSDNIRKIQLATGQPVSEEYSNQWRNTKASGEENDE